MFRLHQNAMTSWAVPVSISRVLIHQFLQLDMQEEKQPETSHGFLYYRLPRSIQSSIWEHCTIHSWSQGGWVRTSFMARANGTSSHQCQSWECIRVEIQLDQENRYLRFEVQHPVFWSCLFKWSLVIHAISTESRLRTFSSYTGWEAQVLEITILCHGWHRRNRMRRKRMTIMSPHSGSATEMGCSQAELGMGNVHPRHASE